MIDFTGHRELHRPVGPSRHFQSKTPIPLLTPIVPDLRAFGCNRKRSLHISIAALTPVNDNTLNHGTSVPLYPQGAIAFDYRQDRQNNRKCNHSLSIATPIRHRNSLT